MNIRLKEDISVSGNIYQTIYEKGTIRRGMLGQGGRLWIVGLMRPLEDHEWELVINDEEVEKEFPSVGGE